MKKVLMVLAEKNFREIEYVVPRAFFLAHCVGVKTVSVSKVSKGRFGYVVANDFTLLKDFDFLKDFDGICFVGGLGSLKFLADENICELIDFYVGAGKVVGAICAAPRILLDCGVLNGRKCTGNDWDLNFEKLCSDGGAIYQKEGVVVDGMFVTADGPVSSEEFALKFIDLL